MRTVLLISVNIAVAAVYFFLCEVCISLTAIAERAIHIECDAGFTRFSIDYI